MICKYCILTKAYKYVVFGGNPVGIALSTPEEQSTIFMPEREQ